MICLSIFFLKLFNILINRFMTVMTFFSKISNIFGHIFGSNWHWMMYLILIDLRICFDTYWCNFMLEITALADYCKISVVSFFFLKEVEVVLTSVWDPCWFLLWRWTCTVIFPLSARSQLIAVCTKNIYFYIKFGIW